MRILLANLLMLAGLTGSPLVDLFAAEYPENDIPPVYPALTRPTPPSVRGAITHPVDRFILAALEKKNAGLNPRANASTLIRRVCLDLTGLPPTPKEIQDFVADPSPDAYARMVERYLASPRYGERWGKHWLDAAGYADSNGYFNADTDRPLAWKYRDYVIRSFNSDKPYDQFVREQLAGDELAGYTPGGNITPAMVEPLIATHFLRNAPDGSGESDGNPDEVRTDRLTVLEGNIQNILNCLTGLTIQCARCHEHKFEPITHEEYYSLQALLYPVYNPDRWKKPNERVLEIGDKAELAANQRLREQLDRQIKAAQDGLAGIADPLREQLLDERLKKLEANEAAAILQAMKTAKDKQSAEQKKLLKTHEKLVAISEEDLATRFGEFKALRQEANKLMEACKKQRPPSPEKIAAYYETDPNPAVHHLLKRGQHGKPGDAVEPGVPVSLVSSKNPFTVAPKAPGKVSTGRRTAFAQWITSPEHPLLARVMVNRIWQHHFGTGLVSTPDNLGFSGAKPSHQELLDYLAGEFIRSGWSIKAVHRLILNAAVYQQSSTPRQELDAVDPDNRLLARFPLRRMDAETIRDSMLLVSGELDLQQGGPYVPTRRTGEGIVEVDEKTDGAHKRSLYLQQRRTQVMTFLQLFDAPTIVSTCGKRAPSTAPLQSLALLNSEFARARGKAFALRLDKEVGQDAQSRLQLAFMLACGRKPEPAEFSRCMAFLDQEKAIARSGKEWEKQAWADLCQMLLASNAFLYVE